MVPVCSEYLGDLSSRSGRQARCSFERRAISPGVLEVVVPFSTERSSRSNLVGFRAAGVVSCSSVGVGPSAHCSSVFCCFASGCGLGHTLYAGLSFTIETTTRRTYRTPRLQSTTAANSNTKNQERRSNFAALMLCRYLCRRILLWVGSTQSHQSPRLCSSGWVMPHPAYRYAGLRRQLLRTTNAGSILPTVVLD